VNWRKKRTGRRSERRTRPLARETVSRSRAGCMRFGGACRRRDPPHFFLRTSAVVGATACEGRDPRQACAMRFAGPTKASVPTTSREGSRHPGNRDAFHRLDLRPAFVRFPPGSTSASIGLSLTPPTLSPQRGESVLEGPCKRHGAVTCTLAFVVGSTDDLRESSAPLVPAGSRFCANSRLGNDVPSVPAGSTGSGHHRSDEARTECLAVPAPVAAP